MVDVAEASLAQPIRAVAGAPPPRLIVLSDFRLLRDGLELALARSASVSVVGTADLAATPREIAEHRPDALLLDASGASALAAVRPVREALPGIRIVAFGVAEAEEAILACAEAGVAGFVAPGASVDELVAAVHGAVRGELVCSPRAAGLLLGRLRALVAAPRPGPQAGRDPLTRRESEIAQLMGDGLSNKQIARRLGIQGATVKNHVHSILAKLRLNRRGEVAAQLGRGLLRGLASVAGVGLPLGHEVVDRVAA